MGKRETDETETETETESRECTQSWERHRRPLTTKCLFMAVMTSARLLLYFKAVFVIRQFFSCHRGDGGRAASLCGRVAVGGRAHPHLCVPCGAARFNAGLGYPQRDAEPWNTAY